MKLSLPVENKIHALRSLAQKVKGSKPFSITVTKVQKLDPKDSFKKLSSLTNKFFPK